MDVFKKTSIEHSAIPMLENNGAIFITALFCVEKKLLVQMFWELVFSPIGLEKVQNENFHSSPDGWQQHSDEEGLGYFPLSPTNRGRGRSGRNGKGSIVVLIKVWMLVGFLITKRNIFLISAAKQWHFSLYLRADSNDGAEISDVEANETDQNRKGKGGMSFTIERVKMDESKRCS